MEKRKEAYECCWDFTPIVFTCTAWAKIGAGANCHFSDHRIVFDQYGCRITGVATGTGDVPMKEAFRFISANPDMQRLNLEVEFDPGNDGPEEARRREYAAVVESIQFARNELGVGR